MITIEYIEKYSAYYALNTKEQLKLRELLLSPKNNYEFTAFTIVILKELNYDLGKLLRIISTDKKASRRAMNIQFYKKLLVLVKEAIILTEYPNHIEPDGFVSLHKLAKMHRFKVVGIDRNMVVRTFKKYNIDYTKRR